MMRRVADLLGQELRLALGRHVSFHRRADFAPARRPARLPARFHDPRPRRREGLDQGLHRRSGHRNQRHAFSEARGAERNFFARRQHAQEHRGNSARNSSSYFEQITRQIADVQKRYTARKRATNAMDFDDLLALWLKLLQEHADVREHYQRRFQFILVDEYQDTNKLQSDLIDLLAARHHNVMVVGDDAQSIYAWRGANFQNILKFPKRYPGAKVFKIETNYRSTPEILKVANAAIAANLNQFAKESRAGAQVRPQARAGRVRGRRAAGGVHRAARAGTARGRREPEPDRRALPLAFSRAGIAAGTDEAQHPLLHHQRHPFFRAGAHQGRHGVSQAGRQSARRTCLQALAQLLPGIAAKGADKLWKIFSAKMEGTASSVPR